MTTNHTAPDLLEAVGVDWKANWSRLKCPECSTSDARLYHNNNCRRPYTCDLPLTYTGPALGTPELDALLLVAGQKWLCYQEHTTKRNVVKALGYESFEENSGGWISGRLGLLFQSELPGHALAPAIREVQG